VVVGSKNLEKDLDNLEIMTTGEVAIFLKVGVGSVRRWTRNGRLKGRHLGGTGDWRYLRKDVLDFLYGSI
jgi:excisionase family DNA binding protein